MALIALDCERQNLILGATRCRQRLRQSLVPSCILRFKGIAGCLGTKRKTSLIISKRFPRSKEPNRPAAEKDRRSQPKLLLGESRRLGHVRRMMLRP
jgi:hypothetical protein